MALTIKDTAQTPEVKTVDLEIRAYERYVRKGQLYEKGQAYRFTEAQAEILLQEEDETSGRPVWGRYRPAAKRVVVEREVQPKDMTAAPVAPAGPAAVEPSVANIGDDAEIAEFLKDGHGEEGVTV